MSPYFLNDLIIYTFAYDLSYVTVLTQQNSKADEIPISFMSSGIKGTKLNYPEVDNKAYVICKVVKHFMP